MKHTVAEHTEIYRAIKEENYEEAAKRLREHLQESLQELDKYRKNPMNIISNLIKD